MGRIVERTGLIEKPVFFFELIGLGQTGIKSKEHIIEITVVKLLFEEGIITRVVV